MLRVLLKVTQQIRDKLVCKSHLLIGLKGVYKEGVLFPLASFRVQRSCLQTGKNQMAAQTFREARDIYRPESRVELCSANQPR